MDAHQKPFSLKQFLLAVPGNRETVLLGLALAVLSCLPVLVAAYPQMSDYPSHLARYHIMLDGGRSPWLARYYEFDWRWTGNLGVDLLIIPMAKLFGLEPAGRLITAIIPPLLGLSMMSVEWTLRRRIGVGSLLAFVTIWSPALLMGLLNFSLALALALFAFSAWIKLEKWRWRWLLFMPLGLIIWLCHLAGWGVLGLLVFGYEWQRKRGFSAFLAPLPLTLPVIPVLLGGGAAGALDYGKNVGIYKLTVWFMAMRDQSMSLDIDTLVLLLGAFIAAVWFKVIDKRLAWTGLAFLLLSLALPRHLGGGDYTDYRLIAVGLMTGCLAIQWAAPRIVFWMVPSLFLLRLFVTTASWQAASNETEAMLKALDHIPAGARIASVVAEEQESWGNNLFLHQASYATVRRDALVNTHFAVPGVHMLRLRKGVPQHLDPSQRIFYRQGKKVNLARFAPLRDAEYLWYFGDHMPDGMPQGAVIIFQSPGSFLARLAKVQPDR